MRAVLVLILAANLLPVTDEARAVTFESGMERLPVETDIQYLADPTGELDLLEAVRSGDWAGCPTSPPNFGYTEDSYWFRFPLTVALSDSRTFLTFDYPLIDEIDFYLLSGGRVCDHVRIGDRLPFDQRPIRHHDFVLPLDLSDATEHEVYLRVRSTSSLQMPMTLWQEERFLADANTEYLFHGVFFGVMASIALYGLFVFASIRDFNYLSFSFYTLMFMGIPAAMHGYGFQYAWSNLLWFQEKSFVILIPLVAAASYAFARRIMRLHDLAPRISRTFRILAWVCVAGLAPAMVFPYVHVLKVVLAQAVLVEGSILAVGVWAWHRHGSRPAMLFTLAWVAFFLGTLMMILNKLGLVERSTLTEFGPSMGIMAQAIVMSMALTESFREGRRAQQKAKRELIRHQEEASQKLEREVHKRTSELQAVMRQLAQVNEEIEESNKLDGLTGVFNRRAFDERLQMEAERATRTGSSLAILMIDIDKFKNFNDTYGHQIGDDCLINVAKVIEREARRTTDFAARYGGEEFSVILTETPVDAAMQVGERIRAAIEAMEFLVDGTRVPVTVSVGACSCNLSPGDDPKNVVASADQGLYAAKANGRNRVEAGVCAVDPAAADREPQSA